MTPTPPHPDSADRIADAALTEVAQARIQPQPGKLYLVTRPVRKKDGSLGTAREFFRLENRETAELRREYERVTGRPLSPRQLKKQLRAARQALQAQARQAAAGGSAS